MEPHALDQTQQELLNEWLGRWEVVADHSWGLADTRVLEVESDEGRAIVKASGPSNVHLVREIRAHRTWTEPWRATGQAARLIGADEQAHVMAATFLPGHLVQGTPAQDDPETYRQAGRLIAAFHAQYEAFDATFNERLRERVERFLAAPHRISPPTVQRIHAEVSDWPAGGAVVVPTHGDWAPRNWLDDQGLLRVIDLGRCDLRVLEEDFARLGRQDFARDATLEAAFFDGYGHDPRDPATWRRVNVAEAVGTAVWAHAVGDLDFEAVGHQHLSRLYA